MQYKLDGHEGVMIEHASDARIWYVVAYGERIGDVHTQANSRGGYGVAVHYPSGEVFELTPNDGNRTGFDWILATEYRS